MLRITGRQAKPQVTIVIPNFNGRRYLPRCLSSAVEECSRLDDQAAIVVVDNGSSDGSEEYVRSAFPGVDVLQLGANLGFAGACDRAIRASRSDYCLLLNNDAWFAAGALAILLDFAERGEFAFAGPTVLNPDGTFQSGAIAVDFLGDPPLLGDPTQAAAQPFYVSGSALLLRRVDYLEVGGLDPRFVFLYEEADLQWRALLRGKRVGWEPDAHVYHIGGGTAAGALVSPGATVAMSWQRMYYQRRNNLLMLLKNYAAGTLCWVLPLWLLSAAIECVGMVVTGHTEQVRIYAAALAWNVCHAPATLRSRHAVQKGRLLPDSRVRRRMAPSFTRLRTLAKLARAGTRVQLE